jgi:hypothetical protein
LSTLARVKIESMVRVCVSAECRQHHPHLGRLGVDEMRRDGLGQEAVCPAPEQSP